MNKPSMDPYVALLVSEIAEIQKKNAREKLRGELIEDIKKAVLAALLEDRALSKAETLNQYREVKMK